MPPYLFCRLLVAKVVLLGQEIAVEVPAPGSRILPFLLPTVFSRKTVSTFAPSSDTALQVETAMVAKEVRAGVGKVRTTLATGPSTYIVDTFQIP